MCDFKPGDEVVCVSDDLQWGFYPCPLVAGQVYTVLGVASIRATDGASFSVDVGVPSMATGGLWRPSRFRKVQRKNPRLSIEAFMTVPGGFEEPRRKTPAKKRERA